MAQPTSHYICIHGHFYQPPRENPWLEVIEAQESAHPFHDWNERVEEECYTPNTQARILDEKGFLRDIINNYENISFDFGPTLLSWLEVYAEETYQAILEADALSAKRRSGHGNAVAQAYNHMIMPLATLRDKITQVIWGIEDFRKRFRRDPEGMWLPEAAVDRQTLEILVDHGIRFTILAPRQVERFRPTRNGDWVTLNPDAIDPSQPYLCRLSGGRSIAIFFYNAPISQAIAFEQLLNSGEDFKNRLLAAFSEIPRRPQLVHIATDGESYGHHHRFGEMALAYALERLMDDPEVALTNYAEFLAEHPPSAEAEFREASSWSCVHGVGRWSEDCGCSLTQRPDWNQKWRSPLRKSLDLIRQQVDWLYLDQTASLLKDPWEARNAYLQVILDSHRSIPQFLEVHGSRSLTETERALVLNMLEMQRNRMLMYTSCGWFFDDFTGIETAQILRYAARVLQLAYPYLPDLIDAFLKEFAAAMSNVKPRLHGDEFFRQKIMPGIVSLDQVAGHAAISCLFEGEPLEGKLYCYEVHWADYGKEESGERVFLVGRLTARNQVTTDSRSLIVVVLYLGGVDLRCSVGEFEDEDKYSLVRFDLINTFANQSSTELIRKLDRHFPGDYFSLKDLFAEQRNRIVESITAKLYEEQAAIFESFYAKNKDLARRIIHHGAKLPDTFLAAARFVLQRSFMKELERISAGDFPDNLESILNEVDLWKITPDVGFAEKLIRHRILSLVRELTKNPRDEAIVAEIILFLDLSKNLEITIELREAQILFLKTARALREDPSEEMSPLFFELAERLAVRLNHGNEP